MTDVRAVYKKHGLLRFTSHLDTMRIFARALCRSKLDIWFTEGFNPHPYVMLGLPLSLGFETDCDICDFRITEEFEPEMVKTAINKELPDGLEIIEVIGAGTHIKHIAFTQYHSVIAADFPLLKEHADLFSGILTKDNLYVQKKSKKGLKEVDIKPMLKSFKATAECGSITVESLLTAGEGGLNPELMVTVIERETGFKLYTKHRREKIFNEKMEIFR